MVVSRLGYQYPKKGRTLRPGRRKSGHLQVNLHEGEVHASKKVHQLVLLAFVGPMPEGMQVRHLNGAPADNRLSNLKYGTNTENARDAINHGTQASIAKTACPRGHPLEPPNLVAHQLAKGHRSCLSCARAFSKIQKHPELTGQMQEISDDYYRGVYTPREEEPSG